MVARMVRARGHDRGRPGGNVEVMEVMRELKERLEAMEKERWRDQKEGDVSEPQDEEKREEATPM